MQRQNSLNSTDNPFAIVLWIYERYKRAMLHEIELSKIAKKYANKPHSLLPDLHKKYPHYAIPAYISVLQLGRLLALYQIPTAYVALLPSATEAARPLPPYSSHYDIYSSSFNSLKALSDDVLIATKLDFPPLDNMSKAWRLLPDNKTNNAEPSTKVQKRPASSSSDQGAGKGNKKLHIEQRIALDSTREKRAQGHLGSSTSLTESPFSLLLRMMQNREKATVVIRRRNSIRGKMHGYIKAFDKHFNLAMSDIDEEYYPNSMDAAVIAMGSKMLKRHLPQLLVRGDNIVSVYKYQNTGGGRRGKSDATACAVKRELGVVAVRK